MDARGRKMIENWSAELELTAILDSVFDMHACFCACENEEGKHVLHYLCSNSRRFCGADTKKQIYHYIRSRAKKNSKFNFTFNCPTGTILNICR